MPGRGLAITISTGEAVASRGLGVRTPVGELDRLDRHKHAACGVQACPEIGKTLHWCDVCLSETAYKLDAALAC